MCRCIFFFTIFLLFAAPEVPPGATRTPTPLSLRLWMATKNTRMSLNLLSYIQNTTRPFSVHGVLHTIDTYLFNHLVIQRRQRATLRDKDKLG